MPTIYKFVSMRSMQLYQNQNQNLLTPKVNPLDPPWSTESKFSILISSHNRLLHNILFEFETERTSCNVLNWSQLDSNRNSLSSSIQRRSPSLQKHCRKTCRWETSKSLPLVMLPSCKPDEKKNHVLNVQNKGNHCTWKADTKPDINQWLRQQREHLHRALAEHPMPSFQSIVIKLLLIKTNIIEIINTNN